MIVGEGRGKAWRDGVGEAQVGKGRAGEEVLNRQIILLAVET